MKAQKYKVREPDRFHKGPARAEVNGKWCHVDVKKTPIYNQRFDNVGPFSEGLAAAKKDGLWFHIRMDGTSAYEQRYDYVGSFYYGLARAKKDGKYFYIRPDGKPAHQERFDWASSLQNKEASAARKRKGEMLVREAEKWFYIDCHGNKTSDYDKQKAIREHFSRKGIAVKQINNDCFINLVESRVGRIRIAGDDVYVNIKEEHRPLTDLRDLAVISQDEKQEVLAISIWDPTDPFNSRRLESYGGKKLPDSDYNLFMIYSKEEIDKLRVSETNQGQVA